MSRCLALMTLAMMGFCGCVPVASQPCATDDDCAQGRCRLGACGPECRDDMGCPRGQACTDGACQPRPECAASPDCAEGFSCSEGRCLCASNEACGAGQHCWQGRCEELDRCRADTDCPLRQYCEPTQGVCLAPCTSAMDCAPNTAPEVVRLAFSCQEGRCLQRCIENFDISCGGQGFICEQGVCVRGDCSTLAHCPQGQYCTSASAGRCLEYRVCQSRAECPAHFDCRSFPSNACPPGFDCANTKLCQELPRCLVDTDCASPAYCQQGHCEPSKACTLAAGCAQGQFCVVGRCVPGGCRGHADCPEGQACTDGACRTAPAASNISTLAISPRTAVLAVGGQLKLSLVAFTFAGDSFPLATGDFSVVDEVGNPSSAATVTPSGQVTAVRAGTVRVRAAVSSPGMTPVESSLTILPALTEGRRVTVVDATTGRPLAGVRVLGCNAPPADAPCPSPTLGVTDSQGVALFDAFGGATASFSAASEELRADGYPRYERLSVAMTPARDLLLPLAENPIHGAAGFIADIDFSRAHTDGRLWLGYSVLSVGDVADLDLDMLLGEPFLIPTELDAFPVARLPGSTVGYLRLTVGERDSIRQIKSSPLSFGRGQPGRRAAVAFAGKLNPPALLLREPLLLLSQTGAMNYALEAFRFIPLRQHVADTCEDLDSDRRCAVPECCLVSEDIPDYYRLPGFKHIPAREQVRRTEVILPLLPLGLDTAIVSAVEISDEAGLVPLGFAVGAGGAPGDNGKRLVRPLLLRSGAPYGGVEVGEQGIWAFALRGSESRGDVSGRIVRGAPLRTRVIVPGWLPLPAASYARHQRTVTPEPGRWKALEEEKATLARVTFTGSRNRHVMLFALTSQAPSVRVPEVPVEQSHEDPAAQASAMGEVSVMALAPEVSAQDALDLPGPNLQGLTGFLEAYSRARTW
jgi:hypothetical protein